MVAATGLSVQPGSEHPQPGRATEAAPQRFSQHLLLTGGEPHGGSIDRGGSGSISQEARRGAAANRADSRVGVQIEAPSINGDAAGLTRPLRIDFPGALYHLSSRGDRRESIFAGDADRLDFLDVPAPGCERFDADVHAYCLMGNHDPLMLAARQGKLSALMRHLDGVCTQRFNQRHGKVGHVFQGRFEAILVDRDACLLAVCRYIDLNPMRARMVTAPGDWPWSGYRALTGAA